jgi:hypothetical protein
MLNFAENLLRETGAGEAIVFQGEDKVSRRIWSSCSPRFRHRRACSTGSARSSPRCCSRRRLPLRRQALDIRAKVRGDRPTQALPELAAPSSMVDVRYLDPAPDLAGIPKPSPGPIT